MPVDFVLPHVHLIAWTNINEDLMKKLTGWSTDADGGQALSEFAGRACYQSWSKPNPATATNLGYLEHILEVGHESVLEHASASFYVTGVSRSLLTELERHRHLSFSVVSQRYVDESRARFVIPPQLEKDFLGQGELVFAAQRGIDAYYTLVELLNKQGISRKKAREAARATLPNMTETKFVVTGNMRAWRHVLKMRWSEHADREIERFAGLVLDKLRYVAPNIFQDFPLVPFGTNDDSV